MKPDDPKPARRQSPRIPLRAAVLFGEQRRSQGEATNIGLGGICVRGDNQLPVGTSTTILLSLSPSEPVPFSGVVRWRDQAAFGLSFDALGALQIRLLVELLKRARVFG